MPSYKFLPHDELRNEGYLQESNRLFFHPLGLALAVIKEDDGTSRLEILDAREDMEGWIFDAAEHKHVLRMNELRRPRDARRRARFGFVIQPPG